MKIAWRDVPRLSRSAALVGGAALLLSLAGAAFDRTAFYQAWLMSWLFLLGIALASMAQVMLHELTGGEWGLVLRPTLEAATMTLPLLAVLGLPLAFGLHDLFPWARGALARDEVVHVEDWYLNAPSFIARNAISLLVWSLFAVALRRHLEDPAGARSPIYGRRIAVAGLLVYLVTVTFAAFDWIASLTPGWYSTSVGIRLGAAQFVAAFAFAISFALLRVGSEPRTSARDFQDLGNLLLTFTMTWAYFAFTQYLIVWGEDLPRETSWYWPRTQTSWRYLALAVVVAVFAIPVLAMLFRGVKRSRAGLATVAAIALAGSWLDLVWLIAPSLRTEGFKLHWLDIAVLIAQGSLWLAALTALIERIPAPRLKGDRTVHA